MSRPIDNNVRREDTDTFVASVSTKCETMEEAVAWTEHVAELIASDARTEPVSDEQPESASSTESVENNDPAASTDVKTDGDTV